MSNDLQHLGSRFRVVAPSNIAFLKYWGKRDESQQWPANNSVSMTLSRAVTETTAAVIPGPHDRFNTLDYDSSSLLLSPRAINRMQNHLNLIRGRLGFSAKLEISTRNSFPTASGIASSASGFAALTLSAIAAWTGSDQFEEFDHLGFTKDCIAHLMRLGSGSACRSLCGGFVAWDAGESPEAQRVKILHNQQHWQLCDLIVILSQSEKTTSSRDAHKLAWTSPLFRARLAGLPERQAVLEHALARRDIEALGIAIESEALEMHAVIMTSNPPVHYLSTTTTKLIELLRLDRLRNGTPAWFTIDAGPNLHVICESSSKSIVLARLHELAREAAASTGSGQDFSIIEDEVGHGPQLSREDNLR